jgi:hypothetical protein
MGDMKNAYKISVRKPDGKRPLQRPNCRWKNIKVDPKQDMMLQTRFILVQGAVADSVNMVLNFWVPSKEGNFFTS